MNLYLIVEDTDSAAIEAHPVFASADEAFEYVRSDRARIPRRNLDVYELEASKEPKLIGVPFES